MIRRWLAERSEQELRNILSEAVMWPGSWFDKAGRRCLIGAANCHATRYVYPASHSAPVENRFDKLCIRFGNVRITRLIHEACLRELTRRGPAVPAPVELNRVAAPVPVQAEATV